MNKLYLLLIFAALFTPRHSQAQANESEIYFRVNQVGYLPDEPKVAMLFSHQPIQDQSIQIMDATSSVVWKSESVPSDAGPYGRFEHHYRLDFSSITKSGTYQIVVPHTDEKSHTFTIGPDIYAGLNDEVLKYIRKQRCGYNPFLDEVCHLHDGRSAYGPMPDGTFIDASGGWHDAADYLRYLLTSGNMVGRLLFTYREIDDKSVFKDLHNDLGQPGANGIPDILDEAKWGLDWMLKMHPTPEQLFHQVADDRDHIGFKLPYADSSDYGWGPDSYRVVYYATGEPQGLGEYQNTSTGIANLAGRYAAVMAMAADIWANDLDDAAKAQQFLEASKEVYEMGKQQPGSQEGTPHLASYRYHEITWTDDMEWGAAELYKVTGEEPFLMDAKKFAQQINPNYS